MKKRLLSVAIMLLTMLGFAMQASAQEAPTLTQKWKITEGLPIMGDARQMIVVDGKIYIQNRVDGKIEIWDANGKSATSLESGKGTNICKDEAGNIIVRVTPFSGVYVDGDVIKVLPADGSAPVNVTLTGLPAARGDYFGEAQGNILDPDNGGRMYITAAGVKSVTVVPIKGGVQDVEKTVNYPLTSIEPDGITTIQTISENEAIITRRSTGNPAITKLVFDFDVETMDDSFKYVTPGRSATAGSFVFTMGGVDYIIYSTSSTSTYKDGFSIAKATDDAANAKIVEHVEDPLAGANGFQSNWVKAEVVSATKAIIYQYYPGGYIAMYEFEVPKPLYMIGQIDKNDYAWAANVGHKMTMGEDGIYTTSVKIATSSIEDGIGAFGFATKLGADASDWNTLNSNRYGAEVDGTMLEEGVESPLLKTDKAFKMEAWTYDVTVDMNKMTVKCVANPAFPKPEPVKTELVQKWKITEGLPITADARQMTVVDGKIYIQNKADGKIEIWDANGKSATSLESGKGTNICKDEAGNIIVRLGVFPNDFAGDVAELRIFPADGGAHVDVVLKDIPVGRSDFFGDARGNVLSADGGVMYLGIDKHAGIYVVPIDEGVQDDENTYLAPIEGFDPGTSPVINAVGETGLTINPRLAGNTILRAELEGETLTVLGKYVTPEHYAHNGHQVFTMGGVDYILYPTSTNVKYEDGFAIAKASFEADNDIIVSHTPEWTAAIAANNFQGNWVRAEVVSDTKAIIYQYYPGGFIAMYEFTTPLPLPEELYVIGDIKESGWDPSNASITLTSSNETYGLYNGSIMPTATSDPAYPNIGFFAISSELGKDNTDWTTFNASRFGPKLPNTILVLNTETTIGNYDTSFGLPLSDKGYDLSVNIITKTISVKLGTGVDQVEGVEYKVVAGFGVINVIGNVNQVDVYNMSGALLQSGKTEIQCAAGIYIVRVDGKAHKVIVK